LRRRSIHAFLEAFLYAEDLCQTAHASNVRPPRSAVPIRVRKRHLQLVVEHADS
jgi:hypothetical protein